MHKIANLPLSIIVLKDIYSFAGYNYPIFKFIKIKCQFTKYILNSINSINDLMEEN
jgi:hypothetical protein